MGEKKYPEVLDADAVGSYPISVGSGGGLVWDEVLEYRVWCHPERGAPDEHDGNDYCYTFATYAEALECHREIEGTEEPLALVLQREHINERQPGEYEHVTEKRLAEWPLDFLERPRRSERTIPDFLAPDAPANRLDIIRGLAAQGK